jgi:AcrR family transcriptional regulator
VQYWTPGGKVTDKSAASPQATPARQDRRVRRTRDAIRRALMDLTTEKGYEAVTVADIIDRADIGRSTFYNHFTDKQHVLHASMDEVGDFLRAQRAARPDQLFAFSRAMFDHVDEQRALLRVLIGRHGSARMHLHIQRQLAELVREDLGAAGGPVDVPIDLTVDFVVGAYLALLSRWVEEADPRTPQEMDAAFRRLVISGVQGVLPPRG